MNTTASQPNKRFLMILLFIPVILSIPLVAMLFTDEVNWSAFDFLVMGTLLLMVGIAAEGVLRKVRSDNGRLLLLLLIGLLFLLTWAELAVGIFGTPFAGS